MDGSTQTTRTGKAGRVIGWQGLLVLAVSLFATVSWAGDLLKIGSLLAYPESYNAKIVQVEGSVTGYRMDHFIGNMTKLEKCIQYFMVKDDTGTINATYATICPVGAVILRNGDRVTIEAYVSRTPGAAGLQVRSVKKN